MEKMAAEIWQFAVEIGSAAWGILLDSSVYILIGILVAGLVKVILNPGTIASHLGRGRFSSVFKAALFGVPLPL